MSQFIIDCPHCKRPVSVDTAWIGQGVRCPMCSLPFTVQQPVPKAPPPVTGIEPGKVCPYCRTMIEQTDSVRVCPMCRTPHHADCWNENKGCTVFGCSMAPPEEEKLSFADLTGQSAYGGLAPHVPDYAPTPPRYGPKTNAPGAVSSLVLGILGLLICGIVFGLLAISEANKAKKAIREQPAVYSGEALATAGMVMGIIDIVLSVLMLVGGLVGNA